MPPHFRANDSGPDFLFFFFFLSSTSQLLSSSISAFIIRRQSNWDKQNPLRPQAGAKAQTIKLKTSHFHPTTTSSEDSKQTAIHSFLPIYHKPQLNLWLHWASLTPQPSILFFTTYAVHRDTEVQK